MNPLTRRAFTRLVALVACAPALLATGCISVVSLAKRLHRLPDRHRQRRPHSALRG